MNIKKKKSDENHQTIEEIAAETKIPSVQSYDNIIVDPYGSWTGIPIYDPYDLPVQDVDDL
jgi:hypothetical protein